MYLPLSLLLVYWPRRTHPRPDVPEPSADPTTAVSSKRGFWQRITCRHLGGRLGAPVLFLRLRQKHPCPAHLPILVLAPKNHLCASVPKGFWGGGRGGTRAFSAMRVVLLRHKQGFPCARGLVLTVQIHHMHVCPVFQDTVFRAQTV